jgi:hypothetical protein
MLSVGKPTVLGRVCRYYKRPHVRLIPVKIDAEPEWSLKGCLMTHMDDQIAKHIRTMILRVMQKPSDSQKQPSKPDTLNQVVQALRRGPISPYDLVFPTGAAWGDGRPKT